MSHSTTRPSSTYYWSRTRNRPRSHRVPEFHRSGVRCKLLQVLRGPRTAMCVWIYRHLPLFTMELWVYINHWYEVLEYFFISVWHLLWMHWEWLLGLPSLWIYLFCEDIYWLNAVRLLLDVYTSNLLIFAFFKVCRIYSEALQNTRLVKLLHELFLWSRLNIFASHSILWFSSMCWLSGWMCSIFFTWGVSKRP